MRIVTLVLALATTHMAGAGEIEAAYLQQQTTNSSWKGSTPFSGPKRISISHGVTESGLNVLRALEHVRCTCALLLAAAQFGIMARRRLKGSGIGKRKLIPTNSTNW